MKKKNIIILCLIIVAVILIIFGCYMLVKNKDNSNKSSNNNSSNQKEVENTTETTKKNEKEYYCYRHIEEDKVKDEIKYKYTKYYTFILTDDGIKSGINKMVSIYKFDSIDDYNNFDIDSILNSTYSIVNDEKNMTYTASMPVTIAEKDTKIEDYSLDTYLELLKGYGFNDCKPKD